MTWVPSPAGKMSNKDHLKLTTRPWPSKWWILYLMVNLKNLGKWWMSQRNKTKLVSERLSFAFPPKKKTKANRNLLIKPFLQEQHTLALALSSPAGSASPELRRKVPATLSNLKYRNLKTKLNSSRKKSRRCWKTFKEVCANETRMRLSAETTIDRSLCWKSTAY